MGHSKCVLCNEDTSPLQNPYTRLFKVFDVKGLETLENLNQGEVLIFIFVQYEAYFTYKTWGRKTNV